MKACKYGKAKAWDAGCPFCTPNEDCSRNEDGCYLDEESVEIQHFADLKDFADWGEA